MSIVKDPAEVKLEECQTKVIVSSELLMGFGLPSLVVVLVSFSLSSPVSLL
jgi:hypothetical protein